MPNLEVVFNRGEAVLWLLIAAIFGAFALRERFRQIPIPLYHSLSVVAFTLFGVSDVIESFTGAWWTPWWLLVLKVACVITFVWCFNAYRIVKKRKSG